MAESRRDEDPETIATRPRAAALVRRGLTPIIVRDAMGSTSSMRQICAQLGVTEADVEWLAHRWPMCAFVKAVARR